MTDLEQINMGTNAEIEIIELDHYFDEEILREFINVSQTYKFISLISVFFIVSDF